MKNIRIISNKIQCNFCGDIISSLFVNDFKFCKCKKVAIDGGTIYLKRVTKNKDDYTELSHQIIEGIKIKKDDKIDKIITAIKNI